MKTTERASKVYPGIYWEMKDGKRTGKMVVSYEGPKLIRDGKPTRNQKKRVVPNKNPTVEDGHRLREQLIAEAREGHHGDKSKATVAQVIDAYTTLMVDTQRNPRTRKAYNTQLRNIRAELGPRRFTEIGAEDLERFLAWLESAPNGRGGTYSSLTIRETWGRFQHLVAWAVRKDYAVRNPFDKVDRKAPPGVRSTDAHPFSHEDRDTFLEYLRQNQPHLHPLYRFWFDTGLRHAELLGAQWQLLDSATAIYRVEVQLIEGALCPPKGTSGKRRPLIDVVLSAGTLDALESYRRGETLRRRLKQPPVEGLIFCQPNSKPLSRHAESSQFKALLTEAGLSRRTPHDIRHTTATLMIAEGASILQVQHQLRHATPTVTLNTYGHLMPSDRRSGFGSNGGVTPRAISQTGTGGH